MKKLVLMILAFMLLQQSSGTIQSIAGVIQAQLLGLPVIHNAQKWEFDPDAGIRRAAQYRQVNGYLGEKQIERLGLGIDGNQQQRLLQQQQQRDQGHLGGLNAFRP